MRFAKTFCVLPVNLSDLLSLIQLSFKEKGIILRIPHTGALTHGSYLLRLPLGSTLPYMVILLEYNIWENHWHGEFHKFRVHLGICALGGSSLFVDLWVFMIYGFMEHHFRIFIVFSFFSYIHTWLYIYVILNFAIICIVKNLDPNEKL